MRTERSARKTLKNAGLLRMTVDVADAREDPAAAAVGSEGRSAVVTILHELRSRRNKL
jgi:hypothetical protein